jgi:hypothetical protein
MATPVLQFKRGNAGVAGTVPALRPGEPAISLNNFDLFIGIDTSVANNKFFGSHRYWGREDGTNSLRLKLVDKDGTNHIAIAASNTLSGVATYRLPNTNNGSSGDFLKLRSVSGGLYDLEWAAVPSGSFSIAGDTGTDTFSGGETLTFAGTASEIETIVTNNQVQIGLPNNVVVGGALTVTTGAVIDGVQIGINGANIIDTVSGNLTLNSAGGQTIIDDLVTIQNNLTVNGNITVGGTTVTLRGTDVYIENKDIILGFTTSLTPNDDTANHAGVAIASTVGSPLVSFDASGINTLPNTYKQLMWFKSGTLGFSTDVFAFNYGVAIGTTTMANGLRLKVGSGITMTDTEITATTFCGALSGTATSTTNIPNLTGAITSNNTTTSLGSFTSANLAAALTDETGSGSAVFATSPTLVTPVLGAASATSIEVSGSINVGTALSAPTIKAATIQHSNGTQAATIDTSGNITASQNLTISGNLFVNGSTTQVNATSMSIEDRTIELGVVDGGSPSTTTTWDLGVLFNYYDGSKKKSALVWEQSDARFKLGSVISADADGSGNSNPQITFTTYAPLEIGGLWVNDCAGQSQVINCSGTTRTLENITIDGGSF